METLNQLDLNLLKVFRAIEETRSITGAGRRLGISQPGMSQALGRLRESLGDDLFVRTSQGMAPTEKAQALAPHVAEVLTLIEESVLSRRTLDLMRLERTFRVSTTDFVEGLLVPGLVGVMEREAPVASLSVTSPRFAFPQEALERGQCDLAIAGFFGALPDGFYQQHLFEDPFLAAVRESHPRLGGKRKLSLDAYLKERHLLIAPGGEMEGGADRWLQGRGQRRQVVVGAGSFLSGVLLTSRTDLVLTAPSRLLKGVAEDLGLRLFEPPLEMAPIRVVQVWHQRHHRDPAHRWFREKVNSEIGDGRS